jgi:phosphopantetheinyl transferase (holo-ACP synthase)
VVNLYGRARSEANKLGVKEIAVSLSHSKEYAIALVVGIAEKNRESE